MSLAAGDGSRPEREGYPDDDKGNGQVVAAFITRKRLILPGDRVWRLDAEGRGDGSNASAALVLAIRCLALAEWLSQTAAAVTGSPRDSAPAPQPALAGVP